MVIEHMPPSYKSMQGAPSLTAEIRRENFHDSLKIHENLETFLLLNLCRLRYVHKLIQKYIYIVCRRERYW